MNKLSIEELKQWVKENSENGKRADAIRELIALREALRGDQVPVYQVEADVKKDSENNLISMTWADVSKEQAEISQDDYGLLIRVLFTAPQKPVVPVGFLFVVKATGAVIYSIADAAIEGTQLIGQIYGDAAIEAAGGIVKEGGSDEEAL